jgi:hypothetical protein
MRLRVGVRHTSVPWSMASMMQISSTLKVALAGFADQVGQQVLGRGGGLQVGHVGLLGHPVGAGEAAGVAHHIPRARARYAAGAHRPDQAAGERGRSVVSNQALPVMPGMKTMRSAANSPPSVTTLSASKP